MNPTTPHALRRFFLREPFCGLSHGMGIWLSVVALVVLIILARGRAWHPRC